MSKGLSHHVTNAVLVIFTGQPYLAFLLSTGVKTCRMYLPLSASSLYHLCFQDRSLSMHTLQDGSQNL